METPEILVVWDICQGKLQKSTEISQEGSHVIQQGHKMKILTKTSFSYSYSLSLSFLFLNVGEDIHSRGFIRTKHGAAEQCSVGLLAQVHGYHDSVPLPPHPRTAG